MPSGDGTGPYGTYINCIYPITGLRRPLYRYGFGGYVPPVIPQTYLPPRPPAYSRFYGYTDRGCPYGSYGYPGYGHPSYGSGYGIGHRRGRGWRGRGRGRW